MENPQNQTDTQTKRTREPLWTRDYVMVCLLYFLSFLGMWMLPNFLPVYISSLGAPSWMLGWVTGVTSIATIIARPVSGMAVDHFGRKGIYGVGSIGMAVTAVLFTFMPVVAAILALRFIQGLFWGATNTSCTTLATDILPKSRFAEGMGYFGMGASLALAIAPALSLGLFYAYGEQVSVLVTAAFFVAAFILSIFVAEKHGTARGGESHVQDYGAGLATADGRQGIAAPTHEMEDAALLERPAGFAGTLPEEENERTTTRGQSREISRRSPLAFIRNSLFEKTALPAAVMIFFAAVSQGVQQTYLATMFDGRGLQAGVTWYFVISAVFAVISRPTFGRLADAKGYGLPATISLVFLTVAMFVLSEATSLVGLLIGAVCQGIGYASTFSIFLAMATRFAPAARRGIASATAMVGFDIGNGGGAVFMGPVVAAWGYGAAFVGAAVFAVLAIVVYFAVVRKKVKIK
jgi:MFS family permease